MLAIAYRERQTRMLYSSQVYTPLTEDMTKLVLWTEAGHIKPDDESYQDHSSFECHDQNFCIFVWAIAIGLHAASPLLQQRRCFVFRS